MRETDHEKHKAAIVELGRKYATDTITEGELTQLYSLLRDYREAMLLSSTKITAALVQYGRWADTFREIKDLSQLGELVDRADENIVLVSMLQRRLLLAREVIFHYLVEPTNDLNVYQRAEVGVKALRAAVLDMRAANGFIGYVYNFRNIASGGATYTSDEILRLCITKFLQEAPRPPAIIYISTNMLKLIQDKEEPTDVDELAADVVPGRDPGVECWTYNGYKLAPSSSVEPFTVTMGYWDKDSDMN